MLLFRQYIYLVAAFIILPAPALASDYVVRAIDKSSGYADNKSTKIAIGPMSTTAEICELLNHPVFNYLANLGELQITSLASASDLMFSKIPDGIDKFEVSNETVSEIAASVNSCTVALVKQDKQAARFSSDSLDELRRQQTNYGGAIFNRERLPSIDTSRSGYLWLLVGFQPAISMLKSDFDAQAALQNAAIEAQMRVQARQMKTESDKAIAEQKVARDRELQQQAEIQANERAKEFYNLMDRLKTLGILFASIAIGLLARPFIRKQLDPRLGSRVRTH